MPFAEVEGRRIHYKLDGSGDTVLVFSNSLGTSLEMWDPQVAALSQHVRILRYDNRGHGLSDPDDTPISMDDLAADALVVMDHASVEEAHFIGLSLGGMVGQKLAVGAPHRISSLTLCATAAYLPPPDSWEKRAQAALSDGMEPMAALSLGRWFTPDYLVGHEQQVEPLLDALRSVDPGSYAVCCRAIRDFDARNWIGRMTVPPLLIAGAEDPATPPAMLREIADLVGSAKFVSVSPAAHILNVEQAEKVSSHILSFVNCCQPFAPAEAHVVV